MACGPSGGASRRTRVNTLSSTGIRVRGDTIRGRARVSSQDRPSIEARPNARARVRAIGAAGEGRSKSPTTHARTWRTLSSTGRTPCCAWPPTRARASGAAVRLRARAQEAHRDGASRTRERRHLWPRVALAPRPPHEPHEIIARERPPLRPRCSAAASSRRGEAVGAPFSRAHRRGIALQRRAHLANSHETPSAPFWRARPRRQTAVHPAPTPRGLARVPHDRGDARVSVTASRAAPRALARRGALDGPCSRARLAVALAVGRGDHLAPTGHRLAVGLVCSRGEGAHGVGGGAHAWRLHHAT